MLLGAERPWGAATPLAKGCFNGARVIYRFYMILYDSSRFYMEFIIFYMIQCPENANKVEPPPNFRESVIGCHLDPGICSIGWPSVGAPRTVGFMLRVATGCYTFHEKFYQFLMRNGFLDEFDQSQHQLCFFFF